MKKTIITLLFLGMMNLHASAEDFNTQNESRISFNTGMGYGFSIFNHKNQFNNEGFPPNSSIFVDKKKSFWLKYLF